MGKETKLNETEYNTLAKLNDMIEEKILDRDDLDFEIKVAKAMAAQYLQEIISKYKLDPKKSYKLSKGIIIENGTQGNNTTESDRTNEAPDQESGNDNRDSDKDINNT